MTYQRLTMMANSLGFVIFVVWRCKSFKKALEVTERWSRLQSYELGRSMAELALRDLVGGDPADMLVTACLIAHDRGIVPTETRRRSAFIRGLAAVLGPTFRDLIAK